MTAWFTDMFVDFPWEHRCDGCDGCPEGCRYITWILAVAKYNMEQDPETKRLVMNILGEPSSAKAQN